MAGSCVGPLSPGGEGGVPLLAPCASTGDGPADATRLATEPISARRSCEVLGRAGTVELTRAFRGTAMSRYPGDGVHWSSLAGVRPSRTGWLGRSSNCVLHPLFREDELVAGGEQQPVLPPAMLDYQLPAAGGQVPPPHGPPPPPPFLPPLS